MKNLFGCLLVVILFIGCSGENKEEVKIEIKEPVIENKTTEPIQSDVSNHCFEIDNDDGKIVLNFVDNNGNVNGDLWIKSKTEPLVDAKITGKDHSGDYVLDVNYEIKGKKYNEKMILNFDSQSGHLARSGTVMVDKKKEERNTGKGTMDVLKRIDCR